MAANDTQFRPGDTDNNLLRKILQELQGSGSSGSGSVIQGAQAQDASPSGNPVVAAAELADPAALPANGVAGTIRRLLASLKGILFVQQADLDRTLDAVTVWPNSGGTTVATTALAASLVIKATPGKLLMLTIYNNKGSSQFIQLHNATALPSNGAVPVLSINIATVTTILLPIPQLTGMDFSTGIVVANSSTAASLTVGSADCWFTAVVI
jgi:hypothetical protein